MSKRLLTLVQISDLHLGYPSAEEASQVPDSWARRNIPAFDGLLGHHRDGLIHLSEFWKRIKHAEDPLLLVTGDLTACGRPEEFDRAREFLEELKPSGVYQVGLGLRDAIKNAIPGNHDHWPGTGAIRGEAHTALHRTLGDFPRALQPITLTTGQVLEIFCVNSDADVAHSGSDRVFARGLFSSQIVKFDTTVPIGPPTGKEIRVLLVHHSLSYESFRPPGMLMIDDDSAKTLREWVVRAGVSVLLTGHVHTAHGHVEHVTDRGTEWDVLEARCGTTTQVDRVPMAWLPKGTKPRPGRFPFNSLIVHRLMQDGKEITWVAEYFERGNKSFESKGRLPGLQKQMIRVWPRGD